MVEQFGFLAHDTRLVKLAFPFDLDLITLACNLLETRHRPLVAFCQRIANRCGEVTERLKRVPVMKTNVKLIYRSGLWTVTVHTEMGQFGYPILPAIAPVHYFYPVFLLHMQ